MRTVCLFLVPHALCRVIVRAREKLMPAPPAREVQHATPIFEAKIENNNVDVHVTCSQPISRLLISISFRVYYMFQTLCTTVLTFATDGLAGGSW